MWDGAETTLQGDSCGQFFAATTESSEWKKIDSAFDKASTLSSLGLRSES